MQPFSQQNEFVFAAAAMPILSATYVDANDRGRHMVAIEQLAGDLERPVSEIQPLYEDILAHFQDCAQVRDYLPLLVSKRLKMLLKN